MSSSAPLEIVERTTGDAPIASVIVLHGLGADGYDFVPICDELELGAVGPVRFVFPHAPVRPVTINAGYRMRAWYDILGTEIDRREDEPGLRLSLGQLHGLVDREVERGIAPRRIALMGFSQGCAMTLLAGLRYRERLAGLAGLSGYLPLAATTAAERHAANADVPVFLAHGSADPVIPIERVAPGHEVEWHEYPMPHSVCAEEVADLNRWVLQVLGG